MKKRSPRRRKSRLERERDSVGLSQTDLSRLSGVSQSFISRIESGGVNDASFGMLEMLANALGRRGCKVQAADLRPRPSPTLVNGDAA